MRDFYAPSMTDQIVPFRIDVSDELLADLRQRLTSTRWPEGEVVDDWSQGTPLAYVQDVCRYWADGYDWRAREAALNRFDQFTTEIDGLDVHFVHARSPHDDALPLIITHGWPGSIVEFHKVIEPLVDPTAHGGDASDAFHVVAPSLPGFGFSGKPTGTGWGVQRIAGAFADVMARLGYDRYVAQGGDWGSAVTSWLGADDPDHCAAIHVTLAMGARPKIEGEPTAEEQRAIDGANYYREWDSGYSKQQSTRPQTVGYGLVDSPAAQAAWILEKFWAWMDCDDHPENVVKPRRAARQHHALLDQRQRRIVGQDLLGELRQGRPAQGGHPVRVRRLPEGDRAPGPVLGGGLLHRHPPLGVVRQGRPLRGVRGARGLRRRPPHLLPAVPDVLATAGGLGPIPQQT